MGLVGRIAHRFIFDKRAGDDPMVHGFVSFIASISIAGLALGVTALLVVTSVMNGFEKELKRALTSFHGHVLLFSRSEPVEGPGRYIKEIKSQFPEVVAVTPYIFSEVMLTSGQGVAGSIVEGIDPETFGQVTNIPEKVISGRLPTVRKAGAPDTVLPEITLGVELARKLKVNTGDNVTLTIPFFVKNGEPVVQRLKVVGVMRVGKFDYDAKYAVVELKDLQKLLQIEGKVNAFKILTRDMEESLKTTAALNDRFVYPLRARDWSSLDRNLFYAIRLEKVVIAIILLAIILVASFNIISTIIMMVHEKQRQIAMLKALGFRNRQTFGVFLIIGGGMAVCGTLLGLGLGRSLCALLQWKSIIDLPADIYMFSRLPVEIRWWEWAIIAVATVLLAVVASIVPALRISREQPAQGLRYE